MSKCYWLLNHKPTKEQLESLEKDFAAFEVVYPSESIQSMWGSFTPDEYISEEYIRPILNWLSKMEDGDMCVIQGDVSATFLIVSRLLDMGKNAYASVTERRAEEHMENGDVVKTSVFHFLRFRKYRR